MSTYEGETASAWVPEVPTLSELAEAVRDCRACGLCEAASGPVFGVGGLGADWMLVGDQPDDCADSDGRPFSGPVGEVLDSALEHAGIPLDRVYVTNAVKAFKHERRGGKRRPRPPDAYDVATCRPWLVAEVRIVSPTVLVALGATAAYAATASRIQLPGDRGRLESDLVDRCVVTLHPLSVVRTPDRPGKKRRFAEIVGDLNLARRMV